MRNGSGIAGATLLYGARQNVPDLVLVMQHLVDDLRGDGRRISGVRLASGSLRLRADPFEIVLTLADGPLPLAALQGLLRPQRRSDEPDFARVHLGRTLRLHRHALGFLIRRRAGPPADPDEGARQLAREGQVCLFAVLRAAPPALLVWQPGGLVLTADEFRSADARLLLARGDTLNPLCIARPERVGLRRPDALGLPVPVPEPPPEPVATHSGALGQLFGNGLPDARAHPVSGIERATDRVTLAMRGTLPQPANGRPRALARLTLVAMLPWLGWLGSSF